VVTYKPAATPVIVSQSFSWKVTEESQRLSYVATLDPKATLQLSYLSGGHWYTITTTAAALCAARTAAWRRHHQLLHRHAVGHAGGAARRRQRGDRGVGPGGAGRQAQHSAGQRPCPGQPGVLRLQHGPAHRPGSLTLTWAGKTATDDGAGGLTGDAVGEVIYATGVIRFRPTRCRTR
jgi:hypothetical protein